jgi:hypothetical protein
VAFFYSTGLRYSSTKEGRGATRVVHSSGIAITDNTWISPSSTCKPGVFFEKDSVKNLTVFGNRIVP